MGKNSFQFRQFTVHQEYCAMKVGTDGTLLGAWADAPVGVSRIMDIGTGTGVIALMMAQRYADAQVVGVDIDGDAVRQARENADQSPFSDRVTIICANATEIDDDIGYDAIVSNPPYFVDSLKCPENQRTLARHTVTLDYRSLITTANKLLNNDGILSIIIPADNIGEIESAVALEGLFITRLCKIKTTPTKPAKRILIEIRRSPVEVFCSSEEILEISPGHRSEWYHELTKDFYLW